MHKRPFSFTVCHQTVQGHLAHLPSLPVLQLVDSKIHKTQACACMSLHPYSQPRSSEGRSPAGVGAEKYRGRYKTLEPEASCRRGAWNCCCHHPKIQVTGTAMVWHRCLPDCATSIDWEQRFGRFKAAVERILKGSRRGGQAEVTTTRPLPQEARAFQTQMGASLPLGKPNCNASFFPCGCPQLLSAPLPSSPSSWVGERNGRGVWQGWAQIQTNPVAPLAWDLPLALSLLSVKSVT